MTNKNYSCSSFSSNSNNESSNNNSMKIFPLSNNSPIMVGVKRGYMVSHAPTTTTHNETAMVAQPSSNDFIDLSRVLKEEVTDSSFKKSRGRSLGSKNKLKASIIVEENMKINMKIIVIEIPPERDIVEVLINYVQCRQVDIIMPGGYGFVSDIILLHPITHVPTLLSSGPFHMTSLPGTYINPSYDNVPNLITHPICSCFSIYLSNPSGKTFDGEVGGKIKDAGVVWITTTLVKKQKFAWVVSTNDDLIAHEANNN